MSRKSYKGKNDNLQKHRSEMMERNRLLIARAIEHIFDLGGKITMSAVARVTHDLADPEKGEKGLTLAGISKNKLYRTMISEASTRAASSNTETKREGGMTTADARLMLHALRVEKIKVEEENRILRRQLLELPRQIETVAPIEETLYQEHKILREMFRSCVFRLNELEVTYLGTDGGLRLAVYEDEIIPPKIVSMLFDEKELRHGR